MNQSFRSFAAAAALLVSLAPAAVAGGANANVGGPGRDGRTYTLRTYNCGDLDAVRVSAWAEGLVQGKRQSLPLKVRKTSKLGVYEFTRAWPAEGQWAIRVELGEGHKNAIVTTLDDKGVVKASQLIYGGDGQKQCEAALAGKDGC